MSIVKCMYQTLLKNVWSIILNTCKFVDIILVQWNNNFGGPLKSKVLYTTNHCQGELKRFGLLVQLLDRLRTVQFLWWRLKQCNCPSYYYLNICLFLNSNSTVSLTMTWFVPTQVVIKLASIVIDHFFWQAWLMTYWLLRYFYCF